MNYDAQIAAALEHEKAGRLQDAVNALGQAATAGSAEAQFLLGVRLLPFVNGPHTQAQGAAFIAMAAEQSHAEALHLSAVMAAAGAGRAPDWTVAIARLKQAAAQGHQLAQGEIAALGDGFSAPQWIISPSPVMQFEAPRVGVIEGFLPKPMCDWLIAVAAPRMKRAAIRSAATGESRESGDRTNSSVAFSFTETDVIFRLVQSRIASALSVSTAHHEYPSVLHYEVGQTFATHYDFFDPASAGYAEVLAQFGQRVATFLIYLNEDFDGGETDFPALNWRFKGRTGDAVFFWNVSPDGALERQLAHTGLPPTRGEKWLFSQWVRERPVPLI